MNIYSPERTIINTSSLRILKLNFSIKLFFSKLFYGSVIKNFSGLQRIIMLSISTLKNPYIVLADDDDDDREFFEEAIAEVKAEVKMECVKDGEELMNLLTSGNAKVPDIIFLDLNMPKKNGFECLKEIRSDKRLMNIPVIIYSTSSHREHVEKTFSEGADFYLTKPESFHELKQITKNIFSFNWDKMPKPTKDEFLLRAKF